MKRLRLRYVLIASAVVVGTIGALHLPVTRPLLARLGVSCPVDAVSADQVESMHHLALDALRGDHPAPTRQAFDLTLLRSQDSDVRQWAAVRHVSCEEKVRGMRYLSCSNVPASALGERVAGEPIEDLTFSFDHTGLLVSIDVLRGNLTGDRAAVLGTSIAERLRHDFGAPTEHVGEYTPGRLSGQAFATSYTKYRFSDSLVSLTAVQMPGRGVTIREQYVGVPAHAAS